jgi:plasmid maintenance system antidote protein VapI
VSEKEFKAMQVRSSRQLLDVFEKEMKREGFSERGLAAKAQLSSNTIHALRQRGGNMTTDTMLRLAKELGVKVRVEK